MSGIHADGIDWTGLMRMKWEGEKQPSSDVAVSRQDQVYSLASSNSAEQRSSLKLPLLLLLLVGRAVLPYSSLEALQPDVKFRCRHPDEDGNWGSD